MCIVEPSFDYDGHNKDENYFSEIQEKGIKSNYLWDHVVFAFKFQ